MFVFKVTLIKSITWPVSLNNTQSSVVASRHFSAECDIYSAHSGLWAPSQSGDGLSGQTPGTGPEQFRPVCGPDRGGGKNCPQGAIMLRNPLNRLRENRDARCCFNPCCFSLQNCWPPPPLVRGPGRVSWEEWAAGAGVRVSTRPGIPDQHPARGDTGSPAANQRPGEGELSQSEGSMIRDGESINPSIGQCHLYLCLQFILFVFWVINSKTRGKQEINTLDKHNHKMWTITRQLGWPDNTSEQGSSTANSNT